MGLQHGVHALRRVGGCVRLRLPGALELGQGQATHSDGFDLRVLVQDRVAVFTADAGLLEAAERLGSRRSPLRDREEHGAGEGPPPTPSAREDRPRRTVWGKMAP